MARSWLFSRDFIERRIVNLSACLAVNGRCSQICIPGTLVEIGLNSPRISLGASGFRSNVSKWPHPPLCHSRMQEISRLAPARSTPSRLMPKAPSEPMRRKSRRPKSDVRFVIMAHSLMIVQELLRVQQRPQQILIAALGVSRFGDRLRGRAALFVIGIAG